MYISSRFIKLICIKYQLIHISLVPVWRWMTILPAIFHPFTFKLVRTSELCILHASDSRESPTSLVTVELYNIRQHEKLVGRVKEVHKTMCIRRSTYADRETLGNNIDYWKDNRFNGYEYLHIFVLVDHMIWQIILQVIHHYIHHFNSVIL